MKTQEYPVLIPKSEADFASAKTGDLVMVNVDSRKGTAMYSKEFSPKKDSFIYQSDRAEENNIEVWSCERRFISFDERGAILPSIHPILSVITPRNDQYDNFRKMLEDRKQWERE